MCKPKRSPPKSEPIYAMLATAPEATTVPSRSDQWVDSFSMGKGYAPTQAFGSGRLQWLSKRKYPGELARRAYLTVSGPQWEAITRIPDYCGPPIPEVIVCLPNCKVLGQSSNTTCRCIFSLSVYLTIHSSIYPSSIHPVIYLVSLCHLRIHI